MSSLPFSATSSKSNNLSRMLICVNHLEHSEPSGEFYSPYLDGPVIYSSVIDLVNHMDAFFDRFGFPQAYNQYRSFEKNRVIPPPGPSNLQEVTQYMKEEEIFETKFGEKATFIIQVQFRQNSTWQGTITWTEKKKVQHFRSTLEMVKLMDSALSAPPDEVFIAWDEEEK